MIYTFGDCALNTQLYMVQRAGQTIRLRPKVFQALCYLLEHRDRIIPRDELCEHVWPDRFISNATLESTLRAVRQVVGDSGQAQQIIRTLHGHGYRFVAAVEVHPEAEPHSQAGAAPSPPTAFSPEPVPEAPAHGALAAERKLVTILCCTLVRPPELRAPPDLDTLYHLAHRTVCRYEGVPQPMVGDCFTALFGVPVAHEDHAVRAVLAALGLHQQMAVRLSLHTGWVAVDGSGDAPDTSVAMVGDTALMVAALQEHAVPGTILCSEATAHLVQRVVRLVPVPPVVGASTLPPASQVLGIRPQRASGVPRGSRRLSPFVGREREMTTLHALLEQAEAGHGQAVGIMGELGMGKSRLLAEFRHSLTTGAYTYLAGRCLSYGQATPYLPLLDMLRANCGITPTDRSEAITAKVQRALREVGMGPDAAPYLLHVLGLPLGPDGLVQPSPQTLKARAMDTLLQMCLNGSRQRPLVLEVEDLHWIDTTSADGLALLVERLAVVPILLVTTYRPGYRPAWLDKSYATQLALARLTSHDSQRVLQAVWHSASVAKRLAQEIVAKAEGNPFFLEELSWTVREQGEHAQSLTVPDTIQTALATRLDRLAPEVKRVLQVAAIIGKEVPVPLLRPIAGLPETTLYQSLRHLQAAEFLYERPAFPEPTYAFKHVLTQEAAYHSLLPRTRRHYHAQITQALVEQFPETIATQPERLAHHYTEAGLPAQAIPYWQQAGQQALQRSAHVEAISHLTTALELLTTLPDTPERIRQELDLLVALGPALMATRGYAAPEVEHTYARARELCCQVEETPQLFPVLLRLRLFYLQRAEFQTAWELSKQCQSLAQRLQDPARLLEAYQGSGTVLFWLGELTQAQAHLEAGVRLYAAEQHSLSSRHRQGPGVTCLTYAALSRWLLGYPDQALQRSQEALTLVRTVSRPFLLAYTLTAVVLLHQLRREAHRVQERAEAIMTISSEEGFPYFLAIGTIFRGWALAKQGQSEEGLAQLHQGLATYRTTGAKMAQSYLLAFLAEAYGAGGQPEAGLQVLDEALAAVRDTGERIYEAQLYRLKGELLRMQSTDHAAEAEACLHRSLAIARRQRAKSLELRAAMSLSRLWQQQGQRAEARELLAPIYGWFTEGFDTADLQEAKALLDELT